VPAKGRLREPSFHLLEDAGLGPEQPGDRFRLQERPAAIRFAERRIATYWAITGLAALGLAAVYLAGGQPQVEGTLLFVAFLFAFWAFAQRWVLAPTTLEAA